MLEKSEDTYKASADDSEAGGRGQGAGVHLSLLRTAFLFLYANLHFIHSARPALKIFL